MTVIFKAKTTEAYHVKVLAELLQSNIKTASFTVNNEGITLKMMDNHRSILINLILNNHNFSYYKCKENEMNMGLNLNHFHKMLKSIKKKDTLELFIDDSSSSDLGIRVIPKDNNRLSTSFIKIQTFQNISPGVPDGYGRPIKIPSSEFQKMCKDMTHIGTNVTIVATPFNIKFLCDAGGVMRREIEFGENENSDLEDEEQYTESFDTSQLTKIAKIAGLGSNISVYPKIGLPLRFESCVGDLGHINIYIKPKSQIEEDNRLVESENEDDC